MLSEKEPQLFSPQFEVVSCFLGYGGEILLLHRQDHKPEGDTWGVPAGKVERGESLEQALLRELKQETGYEAKPKEATYFKKVYVQYPAYSFGYHIYHLSLPRKIAVAINPDEHKGYQWITPADALRERLIPDLDTCIKIFYGL